MSEPRIEISDYLLGELSPSEREEADRLMREDPEFRAQVERLRPLVTQLSDLPAEAWDAPEPPPLRAPATATAESPHSSADAALARTPWHRRLLTLRPAPAAALAAALLALGVGVGFLLGDGGGDPSRPATEVALEPVADPGAGARGTARLTGGADGGEASIEVSDLPASAAGEYYEVWLLNAPDDLVSLGSFRVPASGSAEVSLPLPADPAGFRYLDISLERLSGDPSHSGDSVLRAPT